MQNEKHIAPQLAHLISSTTITKNFSACREREQGNMPKNKTIFAISLIALVVAIDQASKIWIKTNLSIGDEIHIFDWFYIHFIENEGMAFGMTLGGSYGKLLLTLFRLVAVGLIVVLLRRLLQTPHTHIGFLASVSLIMAGAIGNIIDSVLYGVLFSHSHGQVATLLPPEGGYAPLLFGKVVDMLWFPIYEGFLPAWLPIWGNEYILFFRPVFNIADTAISIGVFAILLFQRSFFTDPPTPPNPDIDPKPAQQQDAIAATEPETDAAAESSEQELPAENEPTPP